MVGVVGARTCFWVVLHPKHRLAAVGHRRNGAVVEIEVGDLHGIRGQRRRIEGETVVLAGDFHLTGGAAGVI